MKLALSGTVGLLIVIVLLIHFGMQIYVNAAIEKGDPVNTDQVKNMNRFNLACNILLVIIVIIAVVGYFTKYM